MTRSRSHRCRAAASAARSPRGDLIAVELIYDRILKPGETHTFTFQLDEQQLAQPVRDCRRWAGPPALESLRMSVVFDSTPLPKQVSPASGTPATSWPAPAVPSRWSRESLG